MRTIAAVLGTCSHSLASAGAGVPQVVLCVTPFQDWQNNPHCRLKSDIVAKRTALHCATEATSWVSGNTDRIFFLVIVQPPPLSTASCQPPVLPGSGYCRVGRIAVKHRSQLLEIPLLAHHIHQMWAKRSWASRSWERRPSVPSGTHRFTFFLAFAIAIRLTAAAQRVGEAFVDRTMKRRPADPVPGVSVLPPGVLAT